MLSTSQGSESALLVPRLEEAAGMGQESQANETPRQEGGSQTPPKELTSQVQEVRLAIQVWARGV